MSRILAAALFGILMCSTSAFAASEGPGAYVLLATNKTSTMEEELNAAAAAGYRYAGGMGGETAFGGAQNVVIMARSPDGPRFQYHLLSTKKTSTMQKELQEATDAGYEFKAQTVFNSDIVVILERDRMADGPPNFEYKLLATLKTSTMQKELDRAAAEGFQFVGMTVGQTALGGNEVLAILRRVRSDEE